jgi:hypothetical protein
MSIQIPRSIKPVAAEIASTVRTTGAAFLEQCPFELQDKWEKRCDHELFFQDANRYIGDVYQAAVLDGTIPTKPW